MDSARKETRLNLFIMNEIYYKVMGNKPKIKRFPNGNR